jgi:tetratricopeptide (TPR) repeat protein
MLQLGQAAEARAYLEQRQESLGWTPAYQAAMAECCELLGDWKAASVCWQLVAAAKPDAHTLERLATALFAAEKWSDAISAFERLFKEDPQRASDDLLVAYAACLRSTGQLADARRSLELVLRDNPSHVPALRQMTLVWLEQGDLPAAMAVTRRALGVAPRDQQCLENAAVIAKRLGQADHAAEYAERLRAVDPENRVAAAILPKP